MNEETARSRSIMDALSVLRIPHARVQCGLVKVRGGWMHLADEGYPDIWTALGWLETKTPKGKLNSAQIDRHAELLKWNQRVAVIHSVSEALETINFWQEEDKHASELLRRDRGIRPARDSPRWPVHRPDTRDYSASRPRRRG